MELAMVGLGKMGANMTRRLLRGGHGVAVFDLDGEAVERAVQDGARGAKSLTALPGLLEPPRVVWVMVPSGDPTEKTVNTLSKNLEPDDVVVDGGNSNFKDSIRRAELLIDRCAQLDALVIADARVQPDEGGWQPGELALITVTMSAPDGVEIIDTPGLALLVDVESQAFANVPWGFWNLFGIGPGDSYDVTFYVELADDAPPGATVYVQISPSVGWGGVTACDCPGVDLPELVVAFQVEP